MDALEILGMGNRQAAAKESDSWRGKFKGLLNGCNAIPLEEEKMYLNAIIIDYVCLPGKINFGGGRV